jgi:hypothetical protein
MSHIVPTAKENIKVDYSTIYSHFLIFHCTLKANWTKKSPYYDDIRSSDQE